MSVSKSTFNPSFLVVNLSHSQKKASSFVLGVSGHLDIASDDLVLLQEHIRVVLSKLKSHLAVGVTPYLLTAFARGSDQLVSNVALEEGWKLIALLPMPRDVFLRTPDFVANPKAIENFNSLYEQAKGRVLVLNGLTQRAEPGVKNQFDQAYRVQSRYLALNSSAVLVLWDGQPSRLGACGTSFVVQQWRSRKQESLDDSPCPLLHVRIRRKLEEEEFSSLVVSNLADTNEFCKMLHLQNHHYVGRELQDLLNSQLL